MQNDAIHAGVAPGGLTNRTEIRVLICYLLKAIAQPVPHAFLTDNLSAEGIANYFELNDAVADLEESGHITAIEDGSGKPSYLITQSGADIADTLERTVPIVIRERACTYIIKMLARIRNEKENEVKILPADKGYKVTCRVLDGERELMAVSLSVPNEACAATVRESFLNNPTETFIKVTEALLDHKL